MLKFNHEIFKAYDIRGIFNQDFDSNFAYHLGQTFTAFINKIKNKKGNKISIVVGRDMRLSSKEISDSLISGLIDSGVEVLDIGLVSTPTFYFAVSYLNADGGLIVSASHNPKEWNGFKVVSEKAKPIGYETGLNWILSNFINDKTKKSGGNYKKIDNILEKQFIHDLNYINKEKISNFKIVADAANSMGAPYLKKLTNKLNIELKELNFELDGNFPAHEADPLKDENLEEIKNYIKTNKVDLGISTDGDGDRVFFLDESGELISPAIIRGVLAKIFLKEKPGSKIAYDVRPGKITEDLIIENGGRPVITKVGHSLIKRQMIDEDIYFAGESSGHFFLNLKCGCFEMPVIIIAKLLEELSEKKVTASEYFSKYNKYFHSGEINRLVNNKEEAINKIATIYSDGKISKLDGISIAYPNFWFNIRASNTENKLRLNLEAIDKETMLKKRDEILNIIEENN